MKLIAPADSLFLVGEQHILGHLDTSLKELEVAFEVRGRLATDNLRPSETAGQPKFKERHGGRTI